jgi:NAD(P)-dependent dehydrogenase (short-subunit alcohol dehydrogenase family)
MTRRIRYFETLGAVASPVGKGFGERSVRDSGVTGHSVVVADIRENVREATITMLAATTSGLWWTPITEFWHLVLKVNYVGVPSANGSTITTIKEEVGPKGGVIALTSRIANELARMHASANPVCPGLTETPLLSEIVRRARMLPI